MSPLQATEPLYTTAEVAAMLDRHPGTIKNHAHKYAIGAVFGRTRVFTPAQVEQLRAITLRPSGPRPKPRA